MVGITEAVRVLHAVFEAGVTLVDTADVYCLDQLDIGHNERLIAEALRTWGGDRSKVLVATKGGLRRPHGDWVTDARPERLPKGRIRWPEQRDCWDTEHAGQMTRTAVSSHEGRGAL